MHAAGRPDALEAKSQKREDQRNQEKIDDCNRSNRRVSVVHAREVRDSKKDCTYEDRRRDGGLFLKELLNDTSAEDLFQRALKNKADKHDCHHPIVDVTEYAVILDRSRESDGRHGDQKKDHARQYSGKITRRRLYKSEFFQTLLLKQFPKKRYDTDHDAVAEVSNQSDRVIAEHFTLERVLPAGEVKCDHKAFTDQFRPEFKCPEDQDDLDDIKDLRHVGTIVKRADVLYKFFYSSHGKTPF